MRGSAAIHWFGGQNYELSDRCFAAYVSRHGHAFIDRALYLPKGWTDDPARLKATYVPGDIGFSTKPQLAAEMIERALAAGVPFRWVAADSVYGVGDIERDLRQAGKGYVLGVNSNHWFASWGKPQWVVGTAEEIAKTQRRSDWRRLSAGAEPKDRDCTTGATSNWPISKAKSPTITAKSFGHEAC